MARRSGLYLGAYRVIVYEPALSKLMAPGQDVDKAARYVSRLILAYAIDQAPRSGKKIPWGTNPGSEHLWSKHVRRGRLNRGFRNFAYPIANTAAYARYVHEGTSVIWASGTKPKAKGMLWASAHELGFLAGADLDIVPLGKLIRGQNANPWLNRAGQRAAKQGMHNYGIIRR